MGGHDDVRDGELRDPLVSTLMMKAPMMVAGIVPALEDSEMTTTTAVALNS